MRVQRVYTKETVRTWIEIDRKAIAKNYRTFRKLIGPKTKLMSVIKSNAYGHNIYEFSREMQKLGVDWLGVDSVIEGIRIRKEGIKMPILVLGYTLPTLYEEAREEGISVTLSSFEQLDAMMKLSRKKKKLKVHIKIDTGMHRQGFQWNERDLLLHALSTPKAKERLSIEGLYTHFAEAKNPSFSDSTRRQINEFDKWREFFSVHGYHPLAHASATGGTLLYPNARYDMVRVGIGMYGIWPSGESERALKEKITLHPTLSWHAVVSEVKEVESGERIGYDFTERLTRPTKVAIIPVGYWHGFRRTLSSKGRVLINGRTARVLGRVNMDMIAVDVTDISGVKMGTEVVLIGRSKREEITAGELAKFIGTTPYEVITSLNPLIKRFYV